LIQLYEQINKIEPFRTDHRLKFFMISTDVFMKKATILFIFSLALSTGIYSQEVVRNVIVMIPDGTSASILSLARWYKFGACPADQCRLAVDPHICGLVRTHNSDSPIGGSAPTGSTFATGYLSNAGFVATYGVSSGKSRDLVWLDPEKAYRPLATILEAAKMQGKATGLIMTSQFTHATPADFSAHTHNRNELERIGRQMVHNNVNLVFGGGLDYLDPAKRKDGDDLFSVLRARDYQLVTTLDDFRQLNPEDSLVYALFADVDLPYDLDRDPEQVPSLAEMTKKAIQILSENLNGFFLMVEGSKIDWAAHNNDAAGIITEYLAFDDAVKEAMSFANKDGYTAVVVVPDHGNSGISLGNQNTGHRYTQLSVDTLIQPLKNCKATAVEIARRISQNPDKAVSIFDNNTGINLTTSGQKQLLEAIQSSNVYALPNTVANLISEQTYVGFTTHGHTGEDVMLAIYHPAGYRPEGIIKNNELNHYLRRIMDIESLEAITDAQFAPDAEVLSYLTWKIDTTGLDHPVLRIDLDEQGALTAEIYDASDQVWIKKNGEVKQVVDLPSLALYVAPLHQFFIPRNLKSLLLEHTTKKQ
jgi:alkaline phosphatase